MRAGRERSGDRRQRQVHAAETRLLYDNAATGIAATVVIAALLGYAQWDVRPPRVVAAWLLTVLLIAAGRYILVRRYRGAATTESDSRRWSRAFAVGTAMAAAGWAAAALALYAPGRPLNEFFLVFVIGGVMLGGASLLAPRPEAFLSFLLPAGLVTSLRVASEGDEDHLIMGVLTAVFTIAMVVTTWRFYWVIESSFDLRFDNLELIDSLRSAKTAAEDTNRELEQRVRDRTARLNDADQRKDEFLATLAHELRNPLAPIRFALDSLSGDAPRAATERARRIIERQVGQLVRLVDDLLDVSRITADKIQLRREPQALGPLMEMAVESILPLATAAQQTLDVELPLPSVHVHGDTTRLVQVFTNILSNAVKFTPVGGLIWFTAKPQADVVVVRVRDTGIGLAQEELARVFEMFQQAAPILERSVGGLGIGLTLARRLVEMHDGRIEIRSAGPGTGTEVEIRLPIHAAAETGLPPDTPETAVSRSLRVLIVEDNLDAAEMLDLAVSSLGHATRVAHDGVAAVDLARQFAPDVMFLDIGLPGMNGYEVARALRERPELSDLYIAAVTGWGQEEDRRKARDAGFDGHFTKPLSPAALEGVLATIAERVAAGRSHRGTPRTRLTDSGPALR